jgi:hypothetical protein
LLENELTTVIDKIALLSEYLDAIPTNEILPTLNIKQKEDTFKN